MRFLSVKNFEHYQHYKERRPPWIKLYNDLLDDYAFARLQDASKAHLLCIWLLASRHENRLPYDAEWIGRAIQASGPVDIDILVSVGFLVISDEERHASDVLAPRKQLATPETETERETETDPVARAPGLAVRQKRESTFSLAPYLDAHREVFPGSDPPANRYGKAFKRLEAKHGRDETLRRWRVCLAKKHSFATPEELGAHWSEYATGDAPSKAAVRSVGDAGGEAALVLNRIREMVESFDTPGSGRRQMIRRTRVAELGADVLRAYEAIGGADRILATKPEHWGLVVRDFAAALNAAGAAA